MSKGFMSISGAFYSFLSGPNPEGQIVYEVRVGFVSHPRRVIAAVERGGAEVDHLRLRHVGSFKGR